MVGLSQPYGAQLLASRLLPTQFLHNCEYIEPSYGKHFTLPSLALLAVTIPSELDVKTALHISLFQTKTAPAVVTNSLHCPHERPDFSFAVAKAGMALLGRDFAIHSRRAC